MLFVMEVLTVKLLFTVYRPLRPPTQNNMENSENAAEAKSFI